MVSEKYFKSDVAHAKRKPIDDITTMYSHTAKPVYAATQCCTTHS